jgi:DNA-binding transcriptional LysR family regulator
MLRQLATFLRISDTGNITRAARSLRLSVPMASRHLRWLEDELGAALMKRTTHKLELTDAGRELVTRARGILAAVDDARGIVRAGRGVVGHVVLAVQPAFGLTRIAPLMPALLAKHPRLALDLRFADRAVDLVADGVDVAIRAGLSLADSASVIARRVGSYDIVVCAAPAFLSKHGPVKAVADLARVPCVILDTGSSEWSLETRKGTESVVPHGRVHTNDLLATHALVLAGLGVAWLPTWLAASDLRKGRLVRLLADAVLPTIDVYAMFHKHARGSAAVRAVLEHLTEGLFEGRVRLSP